MVDFEHRHLINTLGRDELDLYIRDNFIDENDIAYLVDCKGYTEEELLSIDKNNVYRGTEYLPGSIRNVKEYLCSTDPDAPLELYDVLEWGSLLQNNPRLLSRLRIYDIPRSFIDDPDIYPDEVYDFWGFSPVRFIQIIGSLKNFTFKYMEMDDLIRGICVRNDEDTEARLKLINHQIRLGHCKKNCV